MGLTERTSTRSVGDVWTGADAAERGLVDQLGGYREAFAVVRQSPDSRPTRGFGYACSLGCH